MTPKRYLPIPALVLCACSGDGFSGEPASETNESELATESEGAQPPANEITTAPEGGAGGRIQAGSNGGAGFERRGPARGTGGATPEIPDQSGAGGTMEETAAGGAVAGAGGQAPVDCASICAGECVQEECTTRFSVFSKAEDATDDIVAVHPFFTIINHTEEAVSLSELELRYYFEKEGTAEELPACYWVSAEGGGCDSTKVLFSDLALPGASRVLHVKFKDGAGDLPAQGSVEIRVGFELEGNPFQQQSNDYSFLADEQYTQNENVVLLKDEIRVWGFEPSAD